MPSELGHDATQPMRIFHRSPPPPLRPYVDRIWGWQAEAGEAVRLPALLPGTGAELYFHYGEPFRYQMDGGPPVQAAPGHLFCIRRRPLRLAPAERVGFVAVRIKIGMLHRFTAIPAVELMDRIGAVEDIWGVAGSALLRRLSWASGGEARIDLIQSFLIDQLRAESADALVESALPMLYRQFAALSIEALADRLHLGRRQLERRWRAFCGLPPQEIRGLCRFQHTVRQLLLDPAASPTHTALAHGYFDQAHFIRDFRHRTGETPLRHLQAARAKSHFYNTPQSQPGMLRLP